VVEQTDFEEAKEGRGIEEIRKLQLAQLGLDIERLFDRHGGHRFSSRKPAGYLVAASISQDSNHNEVGRSYQCPLGLAEVENLHVGGFKTSLMGRQAGIRGWTGTVRGVAVRFGGYIPPVNSRLGKHFQQGGTRSCNPVILPLWVVRPAVSATFVLHAANSSWRSDFGRRFPLFYPAS